MSWLFGRTRKRSGIDPSVMRASAEETRKVRGAVAEKVIELDRDRAHLLAETINETLDAVENTHDHPH